MNEIQVFEVSAGEYDDWTVLGLFVDERDAKKCVKRWNKSDRSNLGDAAIRPVSLYGPGNSGPDFKL